MSKSRNQNIQYSYLIRHSFQYVLIILIAITAISAITLLVDQALKRTAVFGVVALYPLWGLVHHYQEKNLTTEIIIEYLTFTILILWVLLVTV